MIRSLDAHVFTKDCVIEFEVFRIFHFDSTIEMGRRDAFGAILTGRARKRQRDEATGRRGDRSMWDRGRDLYNHHDFSLSVAQSPRRPVAPSPRRPVAQSLCRSIGASLI